MSVREIAGGLLYAPDNVSDIFLMDSPKWYGVLIVPGGRIEREHGEHPQQALVREIREELALEISDLVFVRTKRFKPGELSFHDRTVEFVFFDYFARASSRDFKPNHELGPLSGWYPIDGPYPLPLAKGILGFLDDYRSHLKQTGNNPQFPFTPLSAVSHLGLRNPDPAGPGT